jgi:hypothetical protein
VSSAAEKITAATAVETGRDKEAEREGEGVVWFWLCALPTTAHILPLWALLARPTVPRPVGAKLDHDCESCIDLPFRARIPARSWAVRERMKSNEA